MKRIAAILAASMAISGCAQLLPLQGQQAGFFQQSSAGAPVTISLGGTNTRSILPGMKGAWSGSLNRHRNGQRAQAAGLYISGSTQTKNIKTGEMSVFQLNGTGCAYGLIFIKSEADGAVLFRKMTPETTSYCEQGFVRAQPMNDGTLRISEHDLTGSESSAAIFNRVKKG